MDTIAVSVLNVVATLVYSFNSVKTVFGVVIATL